MFRWQCKPWVSFRYSESLSQIYYEALDFVISAIQKRFEKPDYQIYVSFENLLLKAANKEEFSEAQKVVTEFYDTDFDAQRLKVHLEIFGEDCTKLITKDLHLRDRILIQTESNRTLTRLFRSSEKFNKRSYYAVKAYSCTFSNKCY